MFIDLQKAYDSVLITKLWEALWNTNINHTVIKAIQNLYKGSEAAIKIENSLTEMFSVMKGLKQEYHQHCLKYRIYRTGTLIQWKRKCKRMGIEIDEDTYLYTLQFADDQVLYANDKKDLQYMTRKLIEEYSYWRLSMNVDKTKYLCIGEERTDIESNQEKIESCRRYKYLQYKYLGVLFNT